MIYGKAVAALEGTDGYNEVLAIRDDRPEVRQASDDFDRIAPFFAAAAHHAVMGAAPLGADDAGRERVVAGLRESVHRIDRRFDTRIAEVLDGPSLRSDGIWIRFGLTLRRTGLPDLRLEGEHLTAYDGEGRIERIDERSTRLSLLK